MACNTATWKPLNPLLTDLAILKVIQLTSATIPANTWSSLTFTNVAWDTTSSYNNGTYVYTPPRDGLYRIEINTEVHTSTGWEFNDYIDARITVNSVDRGGDGVTVFQHSTGAAQVFDRVFLRVSIETSLLATDNVEFSIYHTNAANITLFSNYSSLYIKEIPYYGVMP